MRSVGRFGIRRRSLTLADPATVCRRRQRHSGRSGSNPGQVQAWLRESGGLSGLLEGFLADRRAPPRSGAAARHLDDFFFLGVHHHPSRHHQGRATLLRGERAAIKTGFSEPSSAAADPKRVNV